MQTHLLPKIATPAHGRRGFANIVAKAALFLVCGTLWFVLCKALSSEWSLNEQYNYGWFVPFFALYLFWLRLEDRPEIEESEQEKLESRKQAEVGGQKPEVRRHSFFLLSTLAFLLFLLLPVRLFEVGNPDWRPLGWIHGIAVVAFTFVLLWLIGGKTWARHFAFPILFFLVAIPWISPIEAPIIQGLMRGIAAITAETANLLGIPAQVEGNVIRLRNGIVGVNEACSGVRSLQTSIMIGLLFGELYRLTSGRRWFLVIATVAIALAANVLRTFILVWMAATRGLASMEHIHDIAGYIVLLIVFIGALAIGKKLGRKVDEPPTSDLRPRTSDFQLPLPNFYFLLFCIAWLLAVEVAVEQWYRAHEKNLVRRSPWTVQTSTLPGIREIKIDEGVRQTLRYDAGKELLWKTDAVTGTEATTTNYLFFFRWNPSGSSVVRARSHRPDICLPSAGWRQVADFGAKNYTASENITIPIRHISFEHPGSTFVAHTFFCLQEDKMHPDESNSKIQLPPDWSIGARWRVVRNGVRNLGQQVLEIIIVSAQPTNQSAMEDRCAQIVREVVGPQPEVGGRKSDVGRKK